MTEEVAIRRVFRVVSGGTPPSAVENWGGDVTWVTPADLGTLRGMFVGGSRRTLSEDGLRASATLVPAGSIVLSTRAPIGHVAIAGVDLAFNQGCRALLPLKPVDSRFAYYQLRAKSPELQAQGQGSTFSELSSESLAATRIRMPPLAEQRRIADFLDDETSRIDAALETKQRLVSLLPQRIRAATHEAIADLPRTGRLGYAVQWRSGGTPPKDELVHWSGVLPWASTKDLVCDELHDTVDHVTTEAARDHSTVAPPGSVLVATRGMALAKRLPVARTTRPMAFNQDLKALVPLDGVNADFLRVVLRGYEPEILANVVESAHGTRRLETRHLKALRIPLPDQRVQRKRVEHVRAVEEQNDTLVTVLRRQMHVLEERRDVLIAAAVAGRLDPTTYLAKPEAM